MQRCGPARAPRSRIAAGRFNALEQERCRRCRARMLGPHGGPRAIAARPGTDGLMICSLAPEPGKPGRITRKESRETTKGRAKTGCNNNNPGR